MKLACVDWDFQLLLEESSIPVLIIENTNYLREVVSDLYMQVNGQEGHIILSDEDKILPMSKHVEIITNPWILDINQKKILTGLYKTIEKYIHTSDLEERMQRINHACNFLMVEVDQGIHEDLQYNIMIDYVKFCSFMNITIAEEGNICEKTLQYMRLIYKYVIPNGVIIAIRMKEWFTKEEWNLILQQVILEKIPLLCIEEKETHNSEYESVKIIDKDFCFIY